jgi:hypothetical protein
LSKAIVYNKYVNNILTNPPRIRKEEKREVKKQPYRFLLKENSAAFGEKKKRWQYVIASETTEKEGFARSKTIALIKIKISIIREEARLRKSQKKGKGTPVVLKQEKIREEFFRLFGAKSKILSNIKEDSLMLKTIKENVFLFSASKPNFYGSEKTIWIAAISNINSEEEVIFSEGRSRRSAETDVLDKFQERESKKEFKEMRKLLEEGKKI